MVAIKGRKSTSKNPPILSHEFIIQNHADIVSCVAMVFVVGLMVQATSPWAYIFIALHHNVSSMVPAEGAPVPVTYTTGWKDACAVFFYFLIIIVVHAVLQEYIFDKISKKLKLSKTKFSKFNDSCQLITFYFLSVLWGIDIIIRENFVLNTSQLWVSYPASMSFSLKFFFIGQIAYWLHCYPELYFQRVKKEEILNKVLRATTGLVLTFGAYVLNFQQVGVCLIVFHHVAEGLLHTARLIYFMDYKEKVSKAAFYLANTVFLLASLATVALSALVFVYGLGQISDSLDISSGAFNIPAVRYSVLAIILLFQVYRLYVILKKISKYTRENDTTVASKVQKVKGRPKRKEVSKKSVSGGSSKEDELSENDVPRRSLRSRTPKIK